MNADPTRWLLEKDNPSVRYFTLTDICDNVENDSEVRDTKDKIMERGVVPRILARQSDEGYWGSPEDFYGPGKFKGTVWQLMILAELGTDSRDERVRKACEFILDKSQDRESGAFSYLSAPGGGGRHNRVIPCLTGNMIWSLIRFDYLHDPRVQQGIDWITT
ncbi:MAG: nitrogen fixation protein NifH, partial [Promethearchaeota archaeon]